MPTLHHLKGIRFKKTQFEKHNLSWLTCVFLLFFLSFEVISAPSVRTLIEKADKLNIANHPVWLKLLHYEDSNFGSSDQSSAIQTDKFFLSAAGKTNSSSELSETLLSFTQPVNKDKNAHPQCIFRARYIWLRKMLEIKNSEIPPVDCPLYNNWSLNNSTESISIILVTGYLENPASYYGHMLLKFNSPSLIRKTELLDVSINYGAIVPDSVNPVSYIINGITGGYDGGFSHIEYYRHNHNYGEQELRDIWEYELRLTPFQVSLVIAHSWELLGQKYKYYFFRKNCAYRMTEIIELATDLDLIPVNRPWTIPQEIIRSINLKEINGKPLVTKVTYRPSRQSRFYEKFTKLNKIEENIVRKIAHDINYINNTEFEKVDLLTKQNVLDTLLDYYQYRKILESLPNDQINKHYNTLLAQRYLLPVNIKTETKLLPKTPHEGRPPSLFQIGYVHNNHFSNGISFLIRPAYYDSLDADIGHITNSTLKMFESKYVAYKDAYAIRYIDFINIESVNSAISGLEGDSGSAWKLKAGVQQQNLKCEDCLVVRLQGDIGKTVRFADQSLIGSYIGGAVQNNRNNGGTTYGKFTVFANLMAYEIIRARLLYETRIHVNGQSDIDDIISAVIRYSTTTKWELRLNYEKNKASELSLSIGYYW